VATVSSILPHILDRPNPCVLCGNETRHITRVCAPCWLKEIEHVERRLKEKEGK